MGMERATSQADELAGQPAKAASTTPAPEPERLVLAPERPPQAT